MDIISAYREVGGYRGAAGMCGQDPGTDLGEAVAAAGANRGVCRFGTEFPAACRGAEAGVAGRASPWSAAGGVVAG